MTVKDLREYFVDFYGNNSREVLLFDGVCFESYQLTIETAFKKIEEIAPELEYLDELFLDIQTSEYKKIKLDKRMVNNCIPCINITDKGGNIQEFYRDLHEKLQAIPSDNYTLESLLENIFSHFIDRYNDLVIKHNDFAEEYKLFLSEIKKQINFARPDSYKGNVRKSEKCGSVGFVYIATGSDCFYKIGRTKDITSREKTLKTGNHLLSMIAYTQSCNSEHLEALIHKTYKNKNVGGEWFELTKEELEEMIYSFGFSLALSDKEVLN
jgi:hypothetical protein